ncbi:hypothetical protein D3C78_1568910 [compost metagenome]
MPVCPDAPRVSTSTPGWMTMALPFTVTVPPAIVAPPLAESTPPTLTLPDSPPSRMMDPRVPSSELASIRPSLLTTSEGMSARSRAVKCTWPPLAVSVPMLCSSAFNAA